MKCISILFISSIIFLVESEKLFPLSIIHINDIHAKFEQINLNANTCRDVNNCVGGYARVVTMIRQLKRKQPNPLYLNAGDNFQGTLWYTLFRWNVTQYLLNLEPADVMVSTCEVTFDSVIEPFYLIRQLEIMSLITALMD